MKKMILIITLGLTGLYAYAEDAKSVLLLQPQKLLIQPLQPEKFLVQPLQLQKHLTQPLQPEKLLIHPLIQKQSLL
jgi:hypothetical protein